MKMMTYFLTGGYLLLGFLTMNAVSNQRRLEGAPITFSVRLWIVLWPFLWLIRILVILQNAVSFFLHGAR